MKLSFDDFYKDIYGDRWESLKTSLLEKKRHVALLNPFLKLNLEQPHTKLDWTSLAVQPEVDWISPHLVKEVDLFPYYLIDAASLLVIENLNIERGMKILDLCSAPGGKALSMIFKNEKAASWTLNEKSLPRRKRLQRVIDEYLLEEIKSRINITGYDACQWGLHEQNTYDIVLLDAPCSSERHVLHDSKELKSWGAKRVKKLAANQFTMLCSALEATKPGGIVAYSTCSIAPQENDFQIEKLLKKRSGKFEVLRPTNLAFGEATEFGHIVLPDKTEHGPIYFVFLKKL